MIGQRVQSWIWVLTGLMVLTVMGKVIFAPTQNHRSEFAPFHFPKTVPLTGGTSLGSGKWSGEWSGLPRDRRLQKRLLADQLYRYQFYGFPLQVEMRYTLESSGNVMGFLSSYTAIPTAAIQPSLRDERHYPDIGYYLLFVHEQRAYLTSCINPRGGSTVSLPQFRRNRYTYDVQGDRLLKWLFYGDEIRDDRCLWVNMSVPLKSDSVDAADTAYTVLEKAWVPWFKFWQMRFPKP